MEVKKLTKARYKVLAYDKYEKGSGLDSVCFENDSLEGVSHYFNQVWIESEKERDKAPRTIFKSDIGNDETNFFQFYDTREQTYVDGEFEDVWDHVKNLIRSHRFVENPTKEGFE